MSDDDDKIENVDRNELFKKSMQGMTAREKAMVFKRLGIYLSTNISLDDIDSQLNVIDFTRKRIRQIEAKALSKLRRNKIREIPELKCTFCEKLKSEVDSLIQADSRINICNECVKMYKDIIDEDVE